MKAVSCSLGLCGVITKIQLQLSPMFLVRVVNKKVTATEMLDNVETYIRNYDYWQVFWFPFNENVLVQTSEKVENVPTTKGQGARDFFKEVQAWGESVVTKIIAPMLTNEAELTPAWGKGAFALLPQNDYVMVSDLRNFFGLSTFYFGIPTEFCICSFSVTFSYCRNKVTM